MRRHGSHPAMKSSSALVPSGRGGSSRGAPTAPADRACSPPASRARSLRIGSISCSSSTKGAPSDCGMRLIAADGSVGPAERVLKQLDPNIDAFDLSPDGSTLAYSLLETDTRLNVFLTDFPGGTRQLQVTTTGGARPRFSGDGHALYYLARATQDTDPPLGALAKRPIAPQSLQTSGPPVQLFVEGKEPPGILLESFDVASDGRLLTMRQTSGDKRARRRVLLVQNWRAAVDR